MLKVINLIKHNYNWRDILTSPPYNLKIDEEGGFIIMKYTHTNSYFNNEIVRECRGLIIDRYLNPVCIPFFKFTNYRESYADKIDWKSAIVEEKIDGSLIKVWNYKGDWICSTNNQIFARNVPLNSDKEISSASRFINYGELFHAALNNINFSIESLNPQYTYMFELVSPFNQLVVPYSCLNVFHVGTRDNVSAKEIEIDIGIRKPRTYNCSSISDIITMASRLKHTEEGYIVKDKNYNRIKVKSPAYVATKHSINRLNDKRIIEIIQKCETNEVLAYFPEYKQHFDAVLSRASNAAFYLYNTPCIKPENESLSKRGNTTNCIDLPGQWCVNKINPIKWLWSLSSEHILNIINKNRVICNNHPIKVGI